MLRFLSRFLGIWLIAAALVVAVVDGAKSIAASSLVLTPVAETVATLAKPEAITAGSAEPAAQPWPLNLLLAWILVAPTVLVLAIPGFLLLAAGRKRRRFSISREYAT